MTSNNQDNRAQIDAFQYLKSLTPSLHIGDKASRIQADAAQAYTDTFRVTTDPFVVPVSWTIDKATLVNLLGITAYEHYSVISGIRLYAGINDNNQLTLIAVATTNENADANDDLTVNDEYPYYDYANPCPNNCSNSGNLKTDIMIPLVFSRCESF